MKRIVYRIKYNKRDTFGAPWEVKPPCWRTDGWWCYMTQARAVKAAVDAARHDIANDRLAQVVLHGKDGRIRWERTYGRDPKRRKG